MAVELKQIGMYTKKFMIFSIKICYRTARDYPFVLAVALFSVFLYKIFPSLFGFLVSSSPVIFCTAVLLGTLLSFGQPNIPEVEEEEKRSHDVSSLISEGVGDDHVVKKDESFSVEAHIERRRDVDLDGSGIPSMAHELEAKDADSISRSVAIEGDEEVLHGKSESSKEREYHDHGFIENREFHKIEENAGSLSPDDRKKDIVDPETEPVMDVGGTLDAYLDGHDDVSSDSSSDRAESSSPDASMDDVMPMLDELHPLLDSEAPQPALISLDDSEAESDDRSVELAGDVENPDEEETPEDQKDGSEAVVKWTEDDEKNLIDLGTSELERNRRLENLIAKRIAQKNRIAEARKRNLIDFESNDYQQISLPISEEMSRIPIQVSTLSTTRHNPFDSLCDSDEFAGLPPIPGSAPPVLLPRNPFDLPYDQAHATSDLMAENSSSYEFMPPQQRELYFRRHESFTLGASFPGEIMQDRHDGRLQPYLVTEQATSGAMDYASFQRQSSERSESKVISAPETDAVSSLVEQKEGKVLLDEQILQGSGLMSSVSYADKAAQREGKSDEEHYLEIEANVSNIVKDKQDTSGFREAEEEVSSVKETSSRIPAISTTSPVQPNSAEVSVKSKVAEKNKSTAEKNEKILERSADEELGDYDKTVIESPKGLHISMQGMNMDDTQNEKPVYDASPSGIEKSESGMTALAEALSQVDKEVFSSVSSETSSTHIEPSEGDLPSMIVKQSILIRDGEEIASSNKASWVASSNLSAVDENESRSREVTEVSEHDIAEVGFSRVIQNGTVSSELLVETESEMKDAPKDSHSSLSDIISVEFGVMGEGTNHPFEDTQIMSSSNQEVHAVGPQFDVVEKTENVSTSDGLLLADDSTPPSQPLIGETAAEPSYKESQGGNSIIPNKWADKPENSIYSAVSSIVSPPHVDDLTVQPVLEQRSMESSCDLDMKSEEILEKKTDAVSIDMKEDIHDRVQNEYLNDLEEENEKLVVEEDGADGIKEIDEGLLSELDVVGDFSVQEPKSNRTEAERELQSESDVIEDSLVHVGIQENLPELQILQAETVEGVGLEISAELQSDVDQPKSGVESTQFEKSDQDSELKEPSSDLQVLELRSLVDTDLPSKQAHEGEVEKSIILEVGSTKAELANADAYLIHTASELEVLEARSLEDIDSALKRLHEKLVIVEPQLVGSESGPSLASPDCKHPDTPNLELMDTNIEVGSNEIELAKGDADLIKTAVELQVLEARSLGNNDSAFKQPHELVHEKSVIEERQMVESEIGSSISMSDDKHPNAPKLVVVDTEAACAKIELAKGDGDLTETGSELQGLEASTIEHVDSSLKQLHEQDLEKSTPHELQLLESENGQSLSLLDEKHLDPRKLAVMDAEVVSTKIKRAKGDADLIETGSELQVLEARSLEDINSAFKQHHDLDIEKSLVLDSEIRTSPSSADDKHRDPPKLVVMDTEVGPSKVMAEEDADLIETRSELQVQEARSLEDIDSVKQLHEHDPQKSIIDESQQEESETRSHATALDDKHQVLIEIHSDMQVLEARSLEDIHAALKQASEENVENQPKLLETEATERLVDPVSFSQQPSKEMGIDLKESVVGETSTSTEEPSAKKTKDGVKEVHGSSSSSASLVKKRNKKKSSGKSGSSSSSSSSSTSSDSD